MNELKCPFCGQELYIDPCGEIGCLNAKCKKSTFLIGTKELWQELIRTKKQLVTKRNQLEIAVDELKRIDETRSGVKENLHATNGRTLNAGNGFCWTTIDDIHNALEQITAQEQKD